MSDYAQPLFYRFNEDSLRLVQYVVHKNLRPGSILDLGAGCGIIGIELARILKSTDLTLLEVQDEFIPYLKENARFVVKAEIIHASFGAWVPLRRYDCIVSNPPYFDPGRGERSKDLRRDLARSFLLDDWKIFLNLVELCLSPEGCAFIVLRFDQLLLDQVQQNLPTGLKLKITSQENLCFLELSRLNVD